MDRFSAFLLIRRNLKQPGSRNLALATEAIMEELAGRANQPPEPWGVMGLLSQLDIEYAEHNALARGRTARQQAELEGLDPELGRSLERWCQTEPLADRAPVEHALVLAASLAGAALERLEPGATGPLDEPLEQQLDEALAAGLGRELELARQAGDPDGELKDAALSALGLTAAEAAQLALAGLRRAAGDLR